MARKNDRADAHMFYVQQMHEIPAIADLLHIPQSTLYRWKDEDAEAGKDWDKDREAFRITPAARANEMIVEAAKTLKVTLDAAKTPGTKIDSQALFAVNKLLELAEKLNRNQHMYPYIIMMTKELTEFFEEQNPELLEKMLPTLKKFGEAMAKKYRRA